MNYKTILLTGGAGFVGSHLAINLKEHVEGIRVIALDNLKRKGSELNIPRLLAYGVEFLHGDVRNKEDIEGAGDCDLLIECSAEPSVLAGLTSSPSYTIDTNLMGAINCFEFARTHETDLIFLSTSRVYSMRSLNAISYVETESRFELSDHQSQIGVSEKGIAEDFSINGIRSLYGATKLCSEQILQEYIETYKIRGVINRCGIITGPWQMGKIDQGIFAYWMARHIYKDKPLTYFGYGGFGKQVRDFIHVEDLFEALIFQMEHMDEHSGAIYNLGGGVENSLSLLELTKICQKVSGNTIQVREEPTGRPNDIPIYISDTRKFQSKTGWSCKKDSLTTCNEIFEWISENKSSLKHIFT